MAVNEATHRKLIWGWLRLFLAATMATLIGRTLYRGQPDPGVNRIRR